MFARWQRLPLADLLRVQKTGRRLQVPGAAIKWLPGEQISSRLAVVVRPDVKKAVERNRLKRWGRAILARHEPTFKIPVDLILILRRPEPGLVFSELEAGVVFLLYQAKIH